VIVACLTTLWLGILTSVHPCPLATNVAALAFIAREAHSTRRVVLSGLAYTLGRMAAYLGVALAILAPLAAAQSVATFLHDTVSRAIGIILILVGMFLLELVRLPRSPRHPRGRPAPSRVGVWKAGGLGVLFALYFCPISAMLFFAGLIPLAVKYQSKLVLPLLFGLGTALPVAVLAGVLAAGTHRLVPALSRLRAIERWARRITGVLFVVVGIGFVFVHIFGVQWPW